MDHYSPMSTSSLDQGQPRPHYRPEAYEGQQSQHDDLMSEQRRQAQPAGQQSHLHEQQRPRQEQQQQQGPDFQQGHRGDHHQQQHPARQTDLRQADDHGASRGPHQHDQQQHYDQHDQQQHYDQHRQQQHLYDQHRQQQQLYDQHQQQQPRYDQHHQQQPRYDQRHQQQLHQSQYPVGQAQADMNYAKVASGHSQHVNQDSAVVLLKDYYHRGEGDGYFFAKEGFVLSDEFPDGILFVLDGKLRQRSSRASQRGHGHGCDQKLRLRAGRIRSGERLLQCNCGNSWECIEQVGTTSVALAMTMVDMLRRTHADVHRILEKFDKLTQTREKMQAELYDHKVQKKKLDRRALAVSDADQNLNSDFPITSAILQQWIQLGQDVAEAAMEGAENLSPSKLASYYKALREPIQRWSEGIRDLCSGAIEEKKRELKTLLGFQPTDELSQELEVTLQRLIKDNYKNIFHPTSYVLGRAKEVYETSLQSQNLELDDSTLKSAVTIMVAIVLAHLELLPIVEPTPLAALDTVEGGHAVIDTSFNKKKHKADDFEAIFLMPPVRVPSSGKAPPSQSSSPCIVCKKSK